MDMFIEGAWVASHSGETDPVTDPSTTQVFDTVPRANAQDAQDAIKAAQQAFKHWSQRTMADRVVILKACATSMRENVQMLGDALHR